MPKDEAPVPPAGPASLSPDVAAAAIVFLDRCPMQGWSEVQAFLRVRVALEAIAMKGGE